MEHVITNVASLSKGEVKGLRTCIARAGSWPVMLLVRLHRHKVCQAPVFTRCLLLILRASPPSRKAPDCAVPEAPEPCSCRTLGMVNFHFHVSFICVSQATSAGSAL